MLSIAAPLMWVDDSGRTWSEAVARRTRIFARRPYVGAFVIALAMMSVVYLGLRALVRHHPRHRHRHRGRSTLALS